MKKILYIITLPEIGGAQKYVFDLATNFKNQYNVLVASGGKINSPLFQKLKKEKIEFYPLKHLKREISPWRDILAVKELRKIIKLFNPHIIHLNSSKAGVVGSLAAPGTQTKVVYTAHGFVFNEPLGKIKKNIYLAAEKFTAPYKNKIITISEYDRQTGIKYKIAPKDKFITIYNGINPKKIKFLSPDLAQDKLNLPHKHKIIGTIANYYPTKALYRLIQAAKIITKKFNNAKFVLIGDGPQKKYLQKEVKNLNLTNNFLFGAIENAASYLKALDVFVLPSQKEGFPYTVLEAMAAEVPIIATAVGGVPEIIKDGENGFLIKTSPNVSENQIIQEIAQKTVYYLEHPEIAQIFTHKAYRLLKTKFTLEKMLKKTLKVYEEI